MSRVLTTAVAAIAVAVQTAVPSFAEARDHATESATVALSVAEISIKGFLHETEPSTDNVTCSIPNWSAVNQQAADVPGDVFVYGRDVAEGALACNDTDAITGGEPSSFDTFLDITIQAYNPYTGLYEDVSTRGCTGSSTASQSTVVCTISHEYGRDDERQLWYRRAIFRGGVFLDANHTVKDVRSERAFGPLAPHYFVGDPVLEGSDLLPSDDPPWSPHQMHQAYCEDWDSGRPDAALPVCQALYDLLYPFKPSDESRPEDDGDDRSGSST